MANIPQVKYFRWWRPIPRALPGSWRGLKQMCLTEAGPALVLRCQDRPVLSRPLAQGTELGKLCLVN